MERLKKILKIIAGACLVVLIIEFGYVFYNLIIDEGKSIYFDGINSLYVNKKNYITVGSNNNNENYLERAKITKYNQKKEKLFEKLYNKGFNGAFFDVVVDDKDLIAVGSYEKDEREHENNLRSALIVKYDVDGNILFESDFQVLGQSKFVDVKVVEDGYLVCGQSIYDNLTIGDSKKGGAFLIKYGKDLKGNDITGEYIGVAKIGREFIEVFLKKLKELIENQNHSVWWENVLYELSNKYPINVIDVNGMFWAEVDYIEDYERILKDYEFVDGKPFGIKEK